MSLTAFLGGMLNEAGDQMVTTRKEERAREDAELERRRGYVQQLYTKMLEEPGDPRHPEYHAQALKDMLALSEAQGAQRPRAKGVKGFGGASDMSGVLTPFLDQILSGGINIHGGSLPAPAPDAAAPAPPPAAPVAPAALPPPPGLNTTMQSSVAPVAALTPPPMDGGAPSTKSAPTAGTLFPSGLDTSGSLKVGGTAAPTVPFNGLQFPQKGPGFVLAPPPAMSAPVSPQSAPAGPMAPPPDAPGYLFKRPDVVKAEAAAADLATRRNITKQEQEDKVKQLVAHGSTPQEAWDIVNGLDTGTAEGNIREASPGVFVQDIYNKRTGKVINSIPATPKFTRDDKFETVDGQPVQFRDGSTQPYDMSGKPLLPTQIRRYVPPVSPEVIESRALRNQLVRQQLQTNTASTDPVLLPPAADVRNKQMPGLGITYGMAYQGGIDYALTGKQMARGKYNDKANKVIMNTASAMADEAGVTLPELRAEFTAKGKYLNTAVPAAMSTMTAAATANDSIQLALDQSHNVQRGSSPVVNRYTQWALGKELAGDPELTKLEIYIYTAAREYARTTLSASGGGNAALTDAASKKADELLAASMTDAQFKAATEGMMADMNRTVSRKLEAINSVSGTVAKFLSVAGTGEKYQPFDNPNPGSNIPTDVTDSLTKPDKNNKIAPEGTHVEFNGKVYKKVNGTVVYVGPVK